MNIGLVLSGGGGKGAYQIGVWKALIELGLDKKITVISGASVGALNTALFMNGDYYVAENIWCNISASKILRFNGKNLTIGDNELEIGIKELDYLMEKINSTNMLATNNSLSWPNISKGIFSKNGLTSIIDENLNLSNVSNSKVLGIIVCTLMPWVSAKYYILNTQTDEKIKSVLLASSAFPIAFGFENIDSYSYIDGGIVDNVPINPLYMCGCNPIIAVYLSPQDKTNKSKYPHTDIIDIKPSRDLGNLITGTFDFAKEHAVARITQGYNDTMDIKNQLNF